VNQALSDLKSEALLLEPTSSIIHISCSTYKTVSSVMIVLIYDVGMPVVLEFSLLALTTKVVSYTTVQRGVYCGNVKMQRYYRLHFNVCDVL